MKVGKIAWTEYRVVGRHNSLSSVQDQLLREKFLVVKNGEEYVGLLTIADTLANPHVLVIDCVRPKSGVDYSTTLENSLAKMEEENVLFLPVFRSGRFHGVVSYQGIAQALREQRETLKHRELSHFSKIEQFESLRCLAGGIAHDFNNLLGAVFASVDMVSSDTSISPKNRAYLDKAAAAVGALTELSGQLLCFSKHGAIIKEKTDIAAFVEENARFIARGHPIAIEVLFSPESRNVKVNRAQFVRVVNNLVINAAQAVGHKRGLLCISGDLVCLSEDAGLPVCDGSYVCISFKDNGPGIPAEHLPYIFDPYYTTKSTGTGFGLAIVFTIVTDHGGFVTVDSKIDRGTTFKVYLPCTTDG